MERGFWLGYVRLVDGRLRDGVFFKILDGYLATVYRAWAAVAAFFSIP